MNEEFWKRFPTGPGIDVLKMKDEIQAQIYEEIKDLSAEELVAYFNRAGAEFRQRGRIVARNSDPLLVKEEPTPYSVNPTRKNE